MNSNILNELVRNYNIKAADIFLIIVKKALQNELKQEELALNFQTALGLDLNVAVDLAVEILFLPEEIKKQILAETGAQESKFVDINSEIKTIVYQANIFLDENLNSRLIGLIASFLQDIRDEFEFKDALMRQPKVGGVGLNSAEADNLLNKLKTKKAEWQQAGINLKTSFRGGQVQESDIDVAAKVAAPQGTPVAPAEVTIDQILQQRAQEAGRTAPRPPAKPFVEAIEAEENFLESTQELPSPVAPVQPLGLQPTEPQPVAPQRVTPPPVRQPEIRQPMIRQAGQASQRPQMSDVKFEPKLYGPLDELLAMSLTDFRRLSKDPRQAILKISNKLEILAGESELQKNQGIKALKSSPLYKIYADIMNKALVGSKSFEQAITERGDITLAEFKAIMELNKSLKY